MLPVSCSPKATIPVSRNHVPRRHGNDESKGQARRCGSLYRRRNRLRTQTPLLEAHFYSGGQVKDCANLSPAPLSQRGHEKDRRQPHGPRPREPTSQSETVPPLRGKDARRFAVPMPGDTQPAAVSSPRRTEPGRAARRKERKFQDGRLDRRGYRGTEMVEVACPISCGKGEN